MNNKMFDGEYVCEINVTPGFTLSCDVACDLMRASIAYAVKRFFKMKTKLSSEFLKESFRYRMAKGRETRRRKFELLVPSFFIELPGKYVRLKGWVDAAGVNVDYVEILAEHPCFAA